jgi:hypothetical protein
MNEVCKFSIPKIIDSKQYNIKLNDKENSLEHYLSFRFSKNRVSDAFRA